MSHFLTGLRSLKHGQEISCMLLPSLSTRDAQKGIFRSVLTHTYRSTNTSMEINPHIPTQTEKVILPDLAFSIRQDEEHVLIRIPWQICSFSLWAASLSGCYYGLSFPWRPGSWTREDLCPFSAAFLKRKCSVIFFFFFSNHTSSTDTHKQRPWWGQSYTTAKGLHTVALHTLAGGTEVIFHELIRHAVDDTAKAETEIFWK